MTGFIEWEIENFSCWNGYIHGVSFSIEIDIFIAGQAVLTQYARLYPRGEGGKDKHLLVKIDPNSVSTDTELSFICSDGSVMCTLVADAGKRGIFTGPKFEEVVAVMRRKKDRLVLRWGTPEKKDRHRTVIYSSSAFFQIKPEMLESNEWESISTITFTYHGDQKRDICVSTLKTASETEITKVKFKLKSYYNEIILARTSIWLLQGDKIMQKHENDCIIVKDYDHILPIEVPLKEHDGVQTLLMSCKIITGRNSQIVKLTTDFPLSPFTIEDYLQKCDSPPPENAVKVLKKDFMCLYKDKDFSDFEIRSGPVSFPTHRGILCARSPVLKTMLSVDMKEASCGYMDLEDLDPPTLGRFLSFLYSGETGEGALQWADASKLYYAADKYLVPSLKKECAYLLRDSVALENVCDILSLADKHQDEELLSVAHEFFLENYYEVLESKHWGTFMLSNSLLAVKTLTNMSMKKGKNK